MEVKGKGGGGDVRPNLSILHTNVDHSSFYQLVCCYCLLLTIVLRLFYLTAAEVADEPQSPVFLHHHGWDWGADRHHVILQSVARV